MVHVTQKNVSALDVDLVVSESLRANRGEQSFAYLISPYMSDFKIPRPLARFASNLVDITDVESFSDLVALLKRHGGEAIVVTRSPSHLLETTLSRSFVMGQAKLLSKLFSFGCDVRISPKLHAKGTITSQAALTGSFNLTSSGRYFNLEEGNLFTNTTGADKKSYNEKLLWARDIIRNQSRAMAATDLGA